MNERLYQLLPPVYRMRDAAQGEPLRALLAVVQEEFDRLEQDVDGLYEDWFVETCADWVIPYIGNLLAARVLQPTGPGSLRGYVANTLAYRRRKGTVGVIEQLARDVTGWPAHAAEFFELLGWTQNVNHIRLRNHRTPDLRDMNRLELIDGPFERAAHTAEVRRIASEGGKYNIPNIGLFVWRLRPYEVERGEAPAVSGLDGGGNPVVRGYTFHPLGLDAPLFNPPRSETELSHLAEEINVPGPLRRRALYDELEARRQALVDGASVDEIYFGDEPVLQIFVDGAVDPVPPEQIAICDLSSWRPAPNEKKYLQQQPDGSVLEVTRAVRVAVDPKLGRITFPETNAPSTVLVDYTYGFSGDVGSGPYPRAALEMREVTWQAGVSRDHPAAGGELIFTDFEQAVQAWNARPAGEVGMIVLMDSRSYATGLTSLQIKEGSQLAIVAADWPRVAKLDSPGVEERRVGQFIPDKLRPHLRGDLAVAGVKGEDPGELLLDGLLLEGKLTVLEQDTDGAAANLGSLRITHSTFVPANGGLAVPGNNEQLRLHIERSIIGDVAVTPAIAALDLVECVVQGAVAAAETAADIQSCTIFGATTARRLNAGNSIFAGALSVTLRQEGCVRFSFVAEDSKTPRRFRCQPETALEERAREIAKAKGLPKPPPLDAAEIALITGRVRPLFTSTRMADAGYAQLSSLCAEEIRTGAEEGSEMGAFRHLLQPLRATNLRTALTDYLRVGLEASLFFVT